MIANNPMRPVCEYATDSQYKEAPNQEQLSCGVIPLDSLPAEWWNYLWGNANQQINNGVVALNNVIAEIINVMSAAGISPVSECTDQLKTAIQLLAQCIGTSTKAGAVKSSDTCGQVSISDTGIMTANGLGNAANLTTTNKGNVVAAINELKSQHEQQITNLESYVQGLQNSTVTGVKLNSSSTVINPTSGIINLGLGSAAKCDITCFLSSDSLAAYAKQNGYFTGASDSWVCCSCDSARLVGSSAAYTAEDIKTALEGKAPTNHASSSTTYGTATATNYGHVKIASLTYSSTDPVDYYITCRTGTGNIGGTNNIVIRSSYQAKGKYTVQFSLQNTYYTPSFTSCTLSFSFNNDTPYRMYPIGYSVSCKVGYEIDINECLCNQGRLIDPGSRIHIASLTNCAYTYSCACLVLSFSYMLERNVAWV